MAAYELHPMRNINKLIGWPNWSSMESLLCSAGALSLQTEWTLIFVIELCCVLRGSCYVGLVILVLTM